MIRLRFAPNGLLLVGIVLSLALLGQPALAGDDEECVPLIKAVNINFSEEGNSISILGKCFGNEAPPKIALCGVELPVKHNTETTIDSILIRDPAADDCVLTVCTNDDKDACDQFWIGAAPYGPEGQLPAWGFGGAMQWVWDDGWIDIAGHRKACWKRCNPRTRPAPIRYHGRRYQWVCDCTLPGGCCHWAPPILPLPPSKDKK